MKKYLRSFLPAATLATLAAVPAAQAELIIGLTTANQLTTFDSAMPSTTTALVPITGIATGVSIVGIDRRPQNGPNNGLLYGLGVSGTTGTLYTLNTTTGAATFISTLNVALNVGNAGIPEFGVDFNPTVDRLRIVSILDQDLRVNVDNGMTTVDGTLAYAAGDANAGANPNIVSLAYSNNFGGATTTVLRDIDSNLDILAIQNPPNDGTLNTSLALGVNVGVGGYDISGLTGTPYISSLAATGGGSQFYTLGASGATLVGNIGTGLSIRDIAAPVGTPTPDGGTGLVGLAALGLLTWAGVRRNRRSGAAK